MAIHHKVEQKSHSGWCRQCDQRRFECWTFICQVEAKESCAVRSVQMLQLFCLPGLVGQLPCTSILCPYAYGTFYCRQWLQFSTLHGSMVIAVIFEISRVHCFILLRTKFCSGLCHNLTGGNNFRLNKPYFVRQCGQSEYSKLTIKEGGSVILGLIWK